MPTLAFECYKLIAFIIISFSGMEWKPHSGLAEDIGLHPSAWSSSLISLSTAFSPLVGVVPLADDPEKKEMLILVEMGR